MVQATFYVPYLWYYLKEPSYNTLELDYLWVKLVLPPLSRLFLFYFILFYIYWRNLLHHIIVPAVTSSIIVIYFRVDRSVLGFLLIIGHKSVGQIYNLDISSGLFIRTFLFLGFRCKLCLSLNLHCYFICTSLCLNNLIFMIFIFTRFSTWSVWLVEFYFWDY